MTDDAKGRITRLLTILTENAPQLDVGQIGPLLNDLAQSVEAAERERCLSLLEVAQRRLVTNRGRGRQSELEEAWNGMKFGVQFLEWGERGGN